MKLTKEIKNCIDKSVLCWLATVSSDRVPNVSPKEIFTYFGKNNIIIANIASPQSVRNIKENENVCLSFIDILVQKGFQLKGKATIIEKANPEFSELSTILETMTAGKFPFTTITKINVDYTKPIIAPRYILYPETTEEEQIESARKQYRL